MRRRRHDRARVGSDQIVMKNRAKVFVILVIFAVVFSLFILVFVFVSEQEKMERRKRARAGLRSDSDER